MAELTRHYARVPDPRDFADPDVAEAIAAIDPSASADRPHRKSWEHAMAALFLRDVGRLGGDAAVLDVAAGSSPVLFWLAGRTRRVVAVDIYGRGAFADREARATFLDDPAASAPYAYPADRLEVLDMDARSLGFPDATFDAVVSFSSIEHFGGPADVARAAAEIGRVLKPGGHAFIATELFLRLHPLDRAPVGAAIRLATRGRRATVATPRRRSTDGFTASELTRRIVGPSGLALVQPLRLAAPPGLLDNVQTIHPDGSVTSATGAAHPHLALRIRRSLLTSVALPLVKPAG